MSLCWGRAGACAGLGPVLGWGLCCAGACAGLGPGLGPVLGAGRQSGIWHTSKGGSMVRPGVTGSWEDNCKAF